MNKVITGILVTLLCLNITACGQKEKNAKVIINEVLIENTSNYQDDYGTRSGWIEIFNRTYGTIDLAAYLLKVSSQPGDTSTYFIPKGDVLTQIKPRQHALFWADGMPNRGTFHANFILVPDKNNWIGLFDSGNKLLDQIVIPANSLQANQSYARVSDAANEWEIKIGTGDKYVTPSTNNKTLDTNAKKDKFALHDQNGFGMTLSAMGVVFLGLVLLFISFYFIGKTAINMSQRKKTDKTAKGNAATTKISSKEQNEIIAAISMALHEEQNNVHDVEETVITISRVKRSYSPWSSKIYSLREIPSRK